MTWAMHPTLGMLAQDGDGERAEVCDRTPRGLTYLRVSGVALPFCLGPSEPTSASPFAPLGLMMDIDGGARFVMIDANVWCLDFEGWRGNSQKLRWDGCTCTNGSRTLMALGTLAASADNGPLPHGSPWCRLSSSRLSRFSTGSLKLEPRTTQPNTMQIPANITEN
jgi:hypothetical protein